MIRIAIFDCDGVMFDSRNANIQFYNQILSHFGKPKMKKEEINYVHSHTGKDSVNHIFRNDPRTKEAQEYRARMDYAPIINYMVMEPHLKEILDYLRPGIKTAICTNRSNTIKKVLDVHGIAGYFDLVVSSLDVVNPKPHPESIFKILNFFNVSLDESIYIGDSEVDQEVALKTGITFVAYKNQTLKAHYHIDNLIKLKEVIDSLSF